MTRKDYIRFAEMVRFLDVSKEVRNQVAEEMARVFRQDNARFDSERWYKAALEPTRADLQRNKRYNVESAMEEIDSTKR